MTRGVRQQQVKYKAPALLLGHSLIASGRYKFGETSVRDGGG